MTIEEAIKKIKESIKPAENLQPRQVPVAECAGEYLDGDFTAEYDVPSFRRSAMDGYAVRSMDIKNAPVTLKVAGEILAGDYKEIPCTKGTAVRIMTGGMIPDGYDCVVMQEDTDYGETEVRIDKSIPAGMNTGEAGEDVKKGEFLIADGTRLTPVHAGILAGQGVGMVRVKSSFSTSIISTGSELVEPGMPLTQGKIYNNSAYILTNSIRSRGLDVAGLYSLPDDEARIAGLIDELKNDNRIIMTTGGVSVGKRDIMPTVLESLGARVIFRGVDIQPGTPTIGAVLGDTLLLCLSGNPYAAMANFEVYFWEAAAHLMGCETLLPQITDGVMDCSYEKKNVHRRLIRAHCENGRVSLPETAHFASVVSNLTSCNCMIDLPAGHTLSPGDPVKLRLI